MTASFTWSIPAAATRATARAACRFVAARERQPEAHEDRRHPVERVAARRGHQRTRGADLTARARGVRAAPARSAAMTPGAHPMSPTVVDARRERVGEVARGLRGRDALVRLEDAAARDVHVRVDETRQHHAAARVEPSRRDRHVRGDALDARDAIAVEHDRDVAVDEALAVEDAVGAEGEHAVHAPSVQDVVLHGLEERAGRAHVPLVDRPLDHAAEPLGLEVLALLRD